MPGDRSEATDTLSLTILTFSATEGTLVELYDFVIQHLRYRWKHTTPIPQSCQHYTEVAYGGKNEPIRLNRARNAK